jgi:hypothetical protein
MAVDCSVRRNTRCIRLISLHSLHFVAFVALECVSMQRINETDSAFHRCPDFRCQAQVIISLQRKGLW